MSANLEALRFLREAREAQSLPDLEGRFAAMVLAFGFTRSTCVLMAEPGKPLKPRILFGLGDVAARRSYLASAAFRHDPTFHAVFGRSHAFSWAEVADLAHGAEAKALFAQARAADLEGLVVPLHGHFGEVSAVVLSGERAETDVQGRATLQACAAMFATHGRKLLDITEDRPTRSALTRRETQVLVWLSRGKTVPEVALILGISIGTAKTHLDRAKVKLGQPSTVPAVLEAARRGWLVDPDDFDMRQVP